MDSCETCAGRHDSRERHVQCVGFDIYGSGYYVAHVLGARLYAQGSVAAEQGNVFQVEFYRPDENRGGLRVFGVARDSAGNVCKVIFASV